MARGDPSRARREALTRWSRLRGIPSSPATCARGARTRRPAAFPGGLDLQQQVVDVQRRVGAVRRHRPGATAHRAFQACRQHRQGQSRWGGCRSIDIGAVGGRLLAHQTQRQLGIERIACGLPGALRAVVQPPPQTIARGAEFGIERGAAPSGCPRRAPAGARSAKHAQRHEPRTRLRVRCRPPRGRRKRRLWRP